MARALSLYKRLLAEFGPQGWWPAKTQFEVVVGALLAQNTNWGNAEKAIANLKGAGALSPHTILKTQNPELETLIRPSGFFRQKAERLRLLTKKYSEIIARNSPPTREELLEVKGIGKETADSILLYAFGLPYFVIDSYTRRFCAHHRLFQGKEYDDYRRFFESSLPRSVPLYKEYHALIVAWGKQAAKAKRKQNEKMGKGRGYGKISRAGAP